jgi:DNA primase
MPLYTDDSIERLRQTVDMAELVGAKTDLKRSGQQLMGICPFHDERSPSFSVDPVQKVFHCFGCGEGGDLFKFVQLTEGLNFREAIESLSDRYGVAMELTEEDPQAAQRRAKRDRLLELLERTAAFYVRNLWESPEAESSREYLKARGLDEALLREFRVGYAPSAWDKVLVASRQSGYSEEELWDAGLTAKNQKGNVYDRFRRRITFPLCDSRGRVLGFGARAVGADQQPKYLNSSENAVFHKGRQVYAADLARAAAAKIGEVILCEGYTDVIAMHQAGLRNTVGLMGTALTEDQVSELARMAPVVALALDADSAGQEAMIRAAKVAEGRKLELRVVPLPAGNDPADIVQQQGPEEITKLVAGSVPFVRFRVDRALLLADLETAEGKDRAVSELAPIITPLPASAMRDELTELAAAALGVSGAKLTEWLGRARPLPAPEPSAAPVASRDSDDRQQRPATSVIDPGARVERAFLVQCLADAAVGREALAAMDLEADFVSPVFLRAAQLILATPAGSDVHAAPEDEELSRTLAELQVRAIQNASSNAALKAEGLRLRAARIEREIVVAQQSDPQALVALVEQRESLRDQIEREVEESLEQTRETQS